LHTHLMGVIVPSLLSSFQYQVTRLIRCGGAARNWTGDRWPLLRGSPTCGTRSYLAVARVHRGYGRVRLLRDLEGMVQHELPHPGEDLWRPADMASSGVAVQREALLRRDVGLPRRTRLGEVDDDDV